MENKLRVNYYWQWEWPEHGKWQMLEPKHWEWVHDDSLSLDCYIDRGVYKFKNNNKKKIFIALESDGHYKDVHEFVKNNWNLFDYIFTFDLELLKLPNARRSIFGGIWYVSDIEPDQKTKQISFCCSNKTIVPSHLERLKLADIIHDKVDMKGNYYGEYANTKEIYEDYKFSIVFECERTPYYFTEKLLNAFTNRCVPINYGCTDLKSFGFDTNGIIQVTSIDEIIKLINSDFNWDEFYNKPEVRTAIEHNFNQAFKYSRFEDFILETYPDIFNELNRG